MNDFGNQLKLARESHGLTQQALADKLYVTRQTVCRWESGNRFPDLVTTKKISEILNVSIDTLMCNTNLSAVVEKTTIADNSISKKIILLLHAFIAAGFIYSVFYTIIGIINGDTFELSVNAAMYLIQACLFITGFILTIKVSLTPHNIGIITSLFFITTSIIVIFNGISEYDIYTNIYFLLLILLSRIILAIGSYNFFCKNTNTKVWSIVIITIISITFIITMLFTLLFALLFVDNKTAFIVMELPEILIPILIVYEIIILNNRRKMVNCENISLG